MSQKYENIMVAVDGSHEAELAVAKRNVNPFFKG